MKFTKTMGPMKNYEIIYEIIHEIPHENYDILSNTGSQALDLR